MEVKALQQILTQFRQMQESLQKQVETVHVEASAGGGMVTVKMNGQKQVTEIRIDPEVFAGKDQELLQDLMRRRRQRSRPARGRRARHPDEELDRRNSGNGRTENSRPVLNPENVFKFRFVIPGEARNPSA